MSSCSPKPSTDSETYGNGLIQLTQKSFCLNIYSNEDNCDDVTVCKVDGVSHGVSQIYIIKVGDSHNIYNI